MGRNQRSNNKNKRKFVGAAHICFRNGGSEMLYIFEAENKEAEKISWLNRLLNKLNKKRRAEIERKRHRRIFRQITSGKE